MGMHRIFLIGFMGVGKTTVSEVLEDRLGCDVYDTDAMVVESEQLPITDIFETKGEEYFRGLETDILRSLSDSGDCVVSCGGGIILREQNISLIKENGNIVWLDASPETILEHVRNDNGRPLLGGKKNVGDIEKLMNDRRARYEHAADIHIDTDGKSPEKIADEIIKKLEM